MKKIVLLSDTHSYMDERILSYVEQADEVWHAGDIGELKVMEALEKTKPTRAVYGNIDDHQIRVIYKEYIFFYCEKVSVLIIHIGGAAGKYTPRVQQLLDLYRPQLFICGHSHILKVMNDSKNNVLYMNPGAVGVYGFHKIRTMLRFEVDEFEIKNLEVVELGERGKPLS